MRREASKGPGEAITCLRNGFHCVDLHINLQSNTPGESRVCEKLVDGKGPGFVGHDAWECIKENKRMQHGCSLAEIQRCSTARIEGLPADQFCVPTTICHHRMAYNPHEHARKKLHYCE
jgi:hypothetical protein